jgi:hypothetical protein
MILAKARVIGGVDGRVRVGLSLPTGFDPEEVVQESVRGNGDHSPAGFHVEPRSGSVGDIFRELEVFFREEALPPVEGKSSTLKITGKLRRGLPFQASVSVPRPPSAKH